MHEIDCTVALCDKVVINNVHVCDFWDIHNLEQQGIVTVNRSNGAGVIYTDMDEAYSSITLGKCALFDSFKVGTVNKDGFPYTYSRLELSIDRGDGTYNLRCWSIEEVKERLKEIERCLSDEWGILIDTDCSKLKTIEINKTIQLDKPYTSYLRPLSLLFRLLPKGKQKNLREIGKIEDIEVNDPHKTFYAGSEWEEIKVYDKTKQLNDKKKKEITTIKREATKEKQVTTLERWNDIEERATKEILDVHFINKNFLRFELTLESKKIKEVFGCNDVSTITDDAINDYCNNFVEKNVVERWETFKKQREKRLKKVIKEEWAKNQSLFVENLLLRAFNEEDVTGLPLVMDVHEIQPLLKSILPKHEQRQRRYRLFTRIVSKCKQNYGEKFVKDDENRMEEIVVKLSQKCSLPSDYTLKVGSALEPSGFDGVFVLKKSAKSS